MARERDKPQCSSPTLLSGPWDHQCIRTGTIKEGGEFYCWQHAPSLVEKRRAARSAKWEAESKDQDLRWNLHTKVERGRDKVMQLCREFVDGANGEWARQKIAVELKKIDKAEKQLESK